MQGKTLDEAFNELIASGVDEEHAKNLAPHKVIMGNQPSNTLILKQITPASLGSLIALYEHKVFVQSVLWDTNPFDQWGVELGKSLGNTLYHALKGEETEDSFDSSTNGLLQQFKQAY